MPLELAIRFDMRAPSFGAPRRDLYQAAREMASWADRNGFNRLLVGEHHGAEDGYTSSPFVVASHFAAVTKGICVTLSAVLLPLHDPVDIAEHLATLDVLSDGRAAAVFGIGYAPREFEMFGVPMGARVRRLEAGVRAIQTALAGEPFEFEGRPCHVTPRPVQDPVPLYLGGRKPQTALRAALLGLGFWPNAPDPALLDGYRNECVRLGGAPRVVVNPAHYAVFVAEDPDREWALLAPHAMHNSNAYARLAVDSPGMIPTHAKVFDDNDVAGLRSSGTCLVLTPEECIALAGKNHARGSSLCFVPLLGGVAPDVGWRSLELFASRVKPRLFELGYLTDAPGSPIGARPTSGETVRTLPITLGQGPGVRPLDQVIAARRDV